MLVCDFQERLQWGEQDEVQSQHWQKDSVTIFPCPIFLRWKGQVWAYSFQIISDDMAQDNAWVQYVMTVLLSKDIPDLLRKIGAPPMFRAIIWSDNCGKQFKCMWHFGWVAACGVKVRNEEGQPTEKNLHLEHHYFGACHGKNISDSEGGVTKTHARNNVINMSWVVEDQRDLAVKLARDLDFLLRTPTASERATFETKKKNSRGHGQLLLTKVRLQSSRSDRHGGSFVRIV